MRSLLLLASIAVSGAPGAAAAAVAVPQTATNSMQLEGTFKLQKGVRCGEHFDVKRFTSDGQAKCLEACLGDIRCAKFSLSTNESVQDCYLYDATVQCWHAAGWITGNKDTRCAIAKENAVVNLKCPFGTVISEIKFASYGTPAGHCGNFSTGTCHEPMTKDIVSDVCLGEQSCSIAASSKVFGEPCPVIAKNLRVHALCDAGPNFNEDTYFNAWSSRHWAKSESEVASRTLEWTSFLRALPDYPLDRFSGRGIIVVAGGKYLESALVLIKMLREMNCALRIQVWHLGEAEMPASHKMLLEPYNVETMNFEDYVSAEALAPIQANVGMRLFQLKPLAILHSDLEEVLLLDSDNCPTRNPAYLFDDANYQKVGTVFWPDFWKTSQENPIWKIIGQEPTNTWEQESGQILIRKSTAWKAINLCVHFNTEFYMRLLNGDKDTFRFAWLAADVDFLMIDTWPTPVGTMKQLSSTSQGFCGHTMLQHDFDGRPLFVHHNQLKEAALDIGQNFRYQKFAPANVRFKAVPVIGLQLANGGTLPCIDIQGTWDSNVDDDMCIVNTTGLDNFEKKYFAAKRSIPSGIFTKPTTALDEKKIPKNHGELVSHRLASPQRAMRTIIANKLRRNANTTCTVNEFEIEAPTFATDRVCETSTVCEVEEVAPTATSDRTCAVSPPKSRTFTVHAEEGAFSMKNNTDESNDVFVKSMPLTLTRYVTYKFILGDLPASEPFMITLSNSGGWSTNPYESGVSKQHSTFLFTPSSNTPTKLYYQSHASQNMGGEIHISEPTFKRAFVEPSMRFTTAYSKKHILFERSDTLGARLGHSDSVGADPVARLQYACEATCATMNDCQAVFVFKTNLKARCHGLSNVGSGVADSKVTSFSSIKVIA